MGTLIARNDALIVRQVSKLTPTPANLTAYNVRMNGKDSASFTSDASATAQEIVEGLQAILAVMTVPPEFVEVAWTEDNADVIVTGPTNGKPFTVVDGPAAGVLTPSTPTTSKSPNHWIAENFDTGALPVSTDDVILTQIGQSYGFLWNLDHTAVNLTSLDIRADFEGDIGLPEINTDSGTPYYQKGYRETHLKISAVTLRIGDGLGNGQRRCKLNLGSNPCSATIYKTSTNPADQDEAPVHLVGSHASNNLHLIEGQVDIAMLPGYTAQWPTIVASGGRLRCGSGVTLGAIEAAGNSNVETRSAVTTLSTRDKGKVTHIGSGNIGTADVNGGSLTIQATGALTITQLNGYSGKTLDLTDCDSLVTITNMNIYAVPNTPFTITDPNNKLVMTNAAVCQNGAQSLKVVTGSGRSVKIT